MWVFLFCDDFFQSRDLSGPPSQHTFQLIKTFRVLKRVGAEDSRVDFVKGVADAWMHVVLHQQAASTDERKSRRSLSAIPLRK